jgi:hypothetical protein
VLAKWGAGQRVLHARCNGGGRVADPRVVVVGGNDDRAAQALAPAAQRGERGPLRDQLDRPETRPVSDEDDYPHAQRSGRTTQVSGFGAVVPSLKTLQRTDPTESVVFSQIFEGKLTVPFEDLTWFRSRENDLERRMLFLGVSATKQNINYEIWLRELALRRCVWCWYAERPESMAMWNNYGPHGVAIVSKIKDVRRALSLPDDALSSVGKVVYLPSGEGEPDRNQISPHKARFSRPYYFKQEAYKYEQEIRFVVACEPKSTGFEGGVLLKVDPKILINELVISPHVVGDEAHSIRESLDSLDLLPRDRIKCPRCSIRAAIPPSGEN